MFKYVVEYWALLWVKDLAQCRNGVMSSICKAAIGDEVSQVAQVFVRVKFLSFSKVKDLGLIRHLHCMTFAFSEI